MDLIPLLRLAHAAERAAAYAYRGHARSLRTGALATAVQRIEADEWEHRANVLRLLTRLGARPSRWLEWKYAIIGRCIGASCHVLGYFIPIYFAGRLESGNVNEYLLMACLVADTPLADARAEILHMAQVEWEHEQTLLEAIRDHPWLPWFERWFGWGATQRLNPGMTETAEQS